MIYTLVFILVFIITSGILLSWYEQRRERKRRYERLLNRAYRAKRHNRSLK